MGLKHGSLVNLSVNSGAVGDTPYIRGIGVYVTGHVSISSRTYSAPTSFSLNSQSILSWSINSSRLEITGPPFSEKPLRLNYPRPDQSPLNLTDLNSFAESWLADYLNPHVDLLQASLLWHTFLEPLQSAWSDACALIRPHQNSIVRLGTARDIVASWDWMQHDRGVKFQLGSDVLVLEDQS